MNVSPVERSNWLDELEASVPDRVVRTELAEVTFSVPLLFHYLLLLHVGLGLLVHWCYAVAMTEGSPNGGLGPW